MDGERAGEDWEVRDICMNVCMYQCILRIFFCFSLLSAPPSPTPFSHTRSHAPVTSCGPLSLCLRRRLTESDGRGGREPEGEARRDEPAASDGSMTK